MKRIFIVAATLAALAAGLWWGATPTSGKSRSKPRIKFYQDSMHPSVKSEHPGTCPICSMELTPIYEGETEASIPTPASGRSIDRQLVTLSKEGVTVAHVQAEPVRRRDILKTLRVSGTIEPDENRTAMLAAPANARVESIQVDHVGLQVRKGDPVVKLFSPDLAQRARFLRIALSNRPAGALRPTSVSQPDGGRPLPTHGPGHTAGGMESGADAAPATATTDLFSSDLPAPLTGIVTERPISIGQYLMEGQKIMTVVDPSVVWFRFDATPSQLEWIRTGQSVRLRSSGSSASAFAGKVMVVEPLLDDARRVAKVRAAVTNRLHGDAKEGRYDLQIGMLAEGQVVVSLTGVLAVPRSAIVYPGRSAWAYVEMSEGTYERRRVRVGREGDEWWEILSGLDEGDRVVTSGNLLIDAQASIERPPDDSGPEESGLREEERPEPMQGLGEAGKEPVALDPGALAAVKAFVHSSAQIAAALAKDDLSASDAAAEELQTRVTPLETALRKTPWSALAHQATKAALLGRSADLKQARERFLAFGAACANLGHQLRNAGIPMSDLHVIHCPMAPEPGLWIQESGKISNPFFGKSMLRCGEEIEPGTALKIQRPTTAGKEPLQEAAPPATEKAMPVPTKTGSETRTNGVSPAPKGEPLAGKTNPQSAGAAHAEASLSLMNARDEIKSEMRARAIAAAGGMKASPTPTLSDTQVLVLQEYFKDVDQLCRLLAADRLDAFNTAVPKLQRHFDSFLRQLAAPPRWGPVVEALRVLIVFGPADNIENARRRFAPFAASTATLLREVVGIRADFKMLFLYQNPQDPEKRQWIQVSAPPVDPFAGGNAAAAKRVEF